jgi:hypothetical protein
VAPHGIIVFFYLLGATIKEQLLPHDDGDNSIPPSTVSRHQTFAISLSRFLDLVDILRKGRGDPSTHFHQRNLDSPYTLWIFLLSGVWAPWTKGVVLDHTLGGVGLWGKLRSN